ncbi:Lar family restriction alleviation protein [Achromobacter sp. NPDC058515]|uniref:Lar family restriction alleviation protein n=1 Tax=Achromobacter sp. NPDC058515 TaxID=3346533 RepID=UPI0036479812
MPDLKPCPFCGSEAFATFKTGDDDIRRHSVHCRERCGAQMGSRVVGHYSEESAVNAWNRRSPDAHLAAQLRECAETLGADQIDEMRASRAYADAMALLDELKKES